MDTDHEARVAELERENAELREALGESQSRCAALWYSHRARDAEEGHEPATSAPAPGGLKSRALKAMQQKWRKDTLSQEEMMSLLRAIGLSSADQTPIRNALCLAAGGHDRPLSLAQFLDWVFEGTLPQLADAVADTGTPRICVGPAEEIQLPGEIECLSPPTRTISAASGPSEEVTHKAAAPLPDFSPASPPDGKPLPTGTMQANSQTLKEWQKALATWSHPVEPSRAVALAEESTADHEVTLGTLLDFYERCCGDILLDSGAGLQPMLQPRGLADCSDKATLCFEERLVERSAGSGGEEFVCFKRESSEPSSHPVLMSCLRHEDFRKSLESLLAAGIAHTGSLDRAKSLLYRWDVSELVAKELTLKEPPKDAQVQAAAASMAAMLREPNWCARALAVAALGKMGPAAEPHAGSLAALLWDEDWRVRKAATEALCELGASLHKAKAPARPLR